MRVLSRIALALVLPICLSMVSASCSDSTKPPDGSVTTCTEDEDCPTGEYCQEGVCTEATVTCEDGGTCPEGMICDDGLCVPDNDGGVDGGDGGDGDLGPAPDIAVVQPTVSDGQYQLNFGDVLIGVPVSGQIVLRNDGDAVLRIMQLNFEMGTDVEDFSIPQETLDALPLVVDPGEEVFFDVVYSASDGETDHGILDVISNDPDEALVQIHLLSEFKGIAQVEVSPRALPFGDVPVGQTSQPLTFTISNVGSGNAVLTVEDVRTQVVGNPNFATEVFDSDGNPAGLPRMLNRGDFLDVDVVYQPQTNADHTDNIVVLSDDEGALSVNVEVSGRGVVGDLTIAPSPIAFGRVRVDTHAEVPVTVTNTGGAPLEISGITLQDAGPTLVLSSADLDLADLPNNPHVMDPDASINLLLTFDPVDIGSEAASLIIDNSGGDPQRIVPVSAEAYIPAAVETEPVGPPAGPVVLNYGQVQLDSGSGTRDALTIDVIIRNIGGEPLQILNIQRTGSLDFSFEPASIPPIDIGLEVPLHVTFSPTSPTQRTGSLLVDTNAPDISDAGVDGRFRIDMQGEGIDPNVFVTPASQQFGDVYVGQAITQQFTVHNMGFGPLRLESISLSVGSAAAYSVQNLPVLPMDIYPATSINFDVVYLPTSLGEDLGAVEVVNSDIGNPQVVVNLSGNGADCPANTIDCNGNPQDGCERTCVPTGAETCNYLDDDCDCDTDEDFDLDNDVQNCGTCNNDCAYPHAEPGCTGGNCELQACLTGWDDCNAWDLDGCETHTDVDPDNCGGCDNACTYDHASANCLASTCLMGSCDPGYADCNSSDGDGCEIDTQSDPNNCNSCGNRCLYPNANGRCLGGTCDLESCLPNFLNCNFNDGDGCEVNRLTDPNNCGWCGNVCPNAGGTPVCVNGICGVSDCNPGWADCDANPADCETNIADDPTNCGGCGTVCAIDHASEDCDNQICVVDTCDPGWGDCDANPSDCETNNTSDPDHCGFCNNACSFAHGVADCQASTCMLVGCDSNYYNIDGNPVNGCECQSDNFASICDDGSIHMGTLSDGANVVITGNLIPDDLGGNRDVDWFSFTAPDNQADDMANGNDYYRVRIEFDPGGGNPLNQYAFDIYRSTNVNHNCAQKGSPVCVADVTYDYRTYPASGNSCVTAQSGTAGEWFCLNGTAKYWMRVYRTSAVVTCDPYIINITFEQ